MYTPVRGGEGGGGGGEGMKRNVCYDVACERGLSTPRDHPEEARLLIEPYANCQAD